MREVHSEEDVNRVWGHLGQVSDMWVVVVDKDLLKIHVHTNHPYVPKTQGSKILI